MTVCENAAGCWPSPLQELLLRAALLDGEAALEAWRQFRGENGFDRLDRGSYRTLPLLYRNLRRLDPHDPELGRLRGIHRRSWYETRSLFRHMAPVLERIQEAAIPTLLLKGAPLALLYYGDAGLRPMTDIDVLVPEESAWTAIRLLQAAGWQLGREWRLLKEEDLRHRHSVYLEDSSGRQLDLHWHVLYLASFRGADGPFLEAAVPCMFEGVATRALCSTDQLIHACVHGLIWNEVPPMRWVADAFTVMSTARIDWDRLVQITQWLGVTLPVSAGLWYLAETFTAPVPEDVRARLRSIPVSRARRLSFERMQAPHKLLGPLDTILALGSEYLASARGRSMGAKLTGFPRYLQYSWALATPSEVWRRAACWPLRRLLHRRAGAPSPQGQMAQE